MGQITVAKNIITQIIGQTKQLGKFPVPQASFLFFSLFLFLPPTPPWEAVVAMELLGLIQVRGGGARLWWLS